MLCFYFLFYLHLQSIENSVGPAASQPQPQMIKGSSLRALMDAVVFVTPCKRRSSIPAAFSPEAMCYIFTGQVFSFQKY